MIPTAVSTTTASAVSTFWTEIPTILNVGFTGFGFLLMYLAYRLLREAAKDAAANPPTVNIIRTFMLISLVMTILACGSEIYKQRFRSAATLAIFVSPSVMPDADTKLSIVASAATGAIDLSVLPVRLSIVDGESVTLQLDNLTERVRSLEEDVRVEKRAKELAQNSAAAAVIQPMASKPDQGIGDVKHF